MSTFQGIRFVVLMMTVVFSFLFNGTVSAKDQTNGVELTYWVSPNPEEIKIGEKLVTDWNKSRPEIHVRMQPIPAGSNSEEVLLAAVVAGTTPDICSNILPSMMNKFVKARSFTTIDGFPDFESFMLSRMDVKTLQGFRSRDGHYYQAPWKVNPVMMAYNVDMLNALNMKPPKTYQEFMDIAERINKDRDRNGRPQRWVMNPSTMPFWWQRLFDFYPFYAAASSGKTLLKDDKVVFNNDAAVQAMRFFADGFRKGYFANTGAVGDLFLEQKCAFNVVGPWAIKYYERAMTQKFVFDFIPILVPDKKIDPVYTYGDPKNISIFSNTKHKKEAWEFVKFLLSKEADLLLMEWGNQIPIRKDLEKDPFFAESFRKNPLLIKFARQAAFSVPLDDSPHLVQILDHLAQQYEAAAVYNVITPEKSIEDAASYVKTVYEYW